MMGFSHSIGVSWTICKQPAPHSTPVMMGFGDGSGISWTTRKLLAPCSRQITTPTPHHYIFTGRMLFLTPSQLSEH